MKAGFHWETDTMWWDPIENCIKVTIQKNQVGGALAWASEENMTDKKLYDGIRGHKDWERIAEWLAMELADVYDKERPYETEYQWTPEYWLRRAEEECDGQER